jgi:hypothetical protein
VVKDQDQAAEAVGVAAAWLWCIAACLTCWYLIAWAALHLAFA